MRFGSPSRGLCQRNTRKWFMGVTGSVVWLCFNGRSLTVLSMTSLDDYRARYAENLLEHMKTVGVISSNTCDSPRRVGDEPQPGEGVLTLSADAKKRIYAPDGIMTHHHAIQYLSFCPPFEKPFDKPPVFPKFSDTGSAASRSVARISPTNNVDRVSPTCDEDPIESTNFYEEIDIDSGAPQSRALSRTVSPDSLDLSANDSSVKSSLHFSTDSSTEDSQAWDDGTVKMTANLGDGSRRFSLQRIASHCELSLNRRRGSSRRINNVRRLKSLGACFAALSCSRRMEDEVDENRQMSEEITANGSTYSLSFGHDDNSFVKHMLTLYEVDEEECSISAMPLLNSSRGKLAFEDDEFDDEYAA